MGWSRGDETTACCMFPLAAFAATRSACTGLQDRDRPTTDGHATGIITELPDDDIRIRRPPSPDELAIPVPSHILPLTPLEESVPALAHA